MKRSQFFLLALLFVGFTPNMLKAQEPDYNTEITYLQNNGNTPCGYLASRFQQYDIVMLGEDHAIKEHVDFVKNVIPTLYAAGVTNLCMEFGAFEMQSRLDSLMNAPEYNEQTARDMMFFYNVGWAYKEYTDIYREVWKFNQTLPDGQKKFRIINISYKYDWSNYESPRNPENMSRVFYLGTPDEFRTRIIEKEVLSKNEKAVVYMGLVHTFTKYGMPILKMNNDDFCDYDNGFTGCRLYRKYPGKVTNIMFHMPLMSKHQAWSGIVSPADGAIEAIMDKNKNIPVGFDLTGSPLGQLQDRSYFSLCHDHFKLEDFFDGYIFIKPFKHLTGCTIDSLYLVGRPWNEVKRQMPDPDWHTANTPEEYIDQITKYANIKNRYSDVISKSIPTIHSGKIDRFINFPSKYVQSRDIDIWLPDNYTPKKKYAVIYMHDGQALFDRKISWNQEEWDVDSVVGSLIKNRKIKDCIVVAIPNKGAYRAAEYYPQKPFGYLPADVQKELLNTTPEGKIQSDNYLRFIVEELKPFMDRHYNTRPDKENTMIMGSSMGGLISMYAICEYPEVFGAAACLSTHWIGHSANPENLVIPDSFIKYLKEHLPSPLDHRIYFDYGTETLDRYYKPHQTKVDEVMKEKKYTTRQWITREFPGKDHSENAWNERLHIPLMFLLPR